MTAPLFPPRAARTMRLPSGETLFWTLAVAAVTLFVVLLPPLSLGQHIEGRYFPVLAAQSAPQATVSRVGQTLCWDWIRDKIRAPDLLDLDVSLDTADGDTYSPEVYDAATGTPWHRGGSLPPAHYDSRFCTTVPQAVPADVPVRLRQTLSYAGFLGLWTLRVPLPTIIAN